MAARRFVVAALDAIALLAVLAAGLFVLALMFPGAAKAQDEYQAWIHKNRPDCCDHRDCRLATVSYTVRGWEVNGALWPVPVKDVIPWPFNVPYACIAGQRVRCLFMSGGG